MPDYGHDLQGGLFPTPRANAVDDVLDLAQLAEVGGLDLVSVQDHPYNAAQLDCLTLLTAIGARTSTIRLAPNVVSLPLRPPAALAKSTATLSRLTRGRLDLGLGAGAFWDAIAAVGGPRRAPREAVDALVEAIDVLRACWAGGSITYAGQFYQLSGYKAGPVPVHPIPIWLGAYKPRMLAVTGRLADGWLPSMGYADPPTLAGLNARIDDAAHAAGREPAAIRRLYNVFGQFGSGAGFLEGTASDWVEQLAELALEQGMSTFILGTDDPRTVHTFAVEVMPALRDLVAAERAGTPGEDGSPRDADPTPLPIDLTVSEAPGGAPTLTPTPDDGTRLTGDLPWDEASRPTAGARDLRGFDAEQQLHPRHLLDIHNALRGELDHVRSVVEQVRQGQLGIGRARSVINTMALRQNNWTLGAFCESYCRIVTGHHTLEDASLFPHLRGDNADLDAVLDRLQDEHEVIADVLERLDKALVALVDADPTEAAAALDRLQGEVDLLTDTLLSHLSYEERELFAPLAEHGLG